MGIGLLLVSILAPVADAGSIQSPGVIAGPDSSAATVGPAAIYYNPAAIAPSEGFDAILDSQLAAIQVQATTTRNDGTDPNTGEPYGVAEAAVVVPVNLIGFTYAVVPDRLAVGLAVTQPFTGGGDYTKSESDPPPYTSHQRYAGIQTKIITVSVTPAVGLTVTDGFHVGAGVSWVYDSISVLQASDPLGTEGAPIPGTDAEPYSMDSLLRGSASGSHMTWNAGFFVDRWEKLQLGVSYASAGTFRADGTGAVELPTLLQNENYDGPMDAIVGFEIPLPAVARVMLASQINDKLRVGAGWEYYYWNTCCGYRDGDILITVTDPAGEPLDADDGSAREVGSPLYSPRRLWNATNVAAFAGYQANDKLWLGGRFGYNQNAVPDYAVSATNLDFTNVGGMLGVRYALAGPVTMGLAFTKYFPLTRTITTSAWDIRDKDSEYYVDDRFSQKSPYKAGTNGTYSADVNIVGLRIGVDL